MQEVIIAKRIPTLALILLACSPSSPNSSVNDGQDSGVPANPDAATRDAGTVDGGSPPATVPNILLLIADDLGADVAPCMAVEPNRVPMPAIEALCDRGLLFTKTWANPMCSPSRATLLTGRYGFRTGVGQLVRGDESPALPLTETTLPNLLKANSGAPYATAAFGK